MYQSLLTRKYLTSKIMPLLSVLAVVGCTATVLVVWSIMGGFLNMLLSSGRSMVGDVIITWPTVGFAHYDDLIRRLEADDQVKAATPVIESFGVITLPDNRVMGVQLMGIDGPSFARVTQYDEDLWWRPIDKPLPKDTKRQDPRLGDKRSAQAKQDDNRFDHADMFEQALKDGRRLAVEDPATGETRPAAVLGIELSGFSVRQDGGWYKPAGFAGRRTESGGIKWMEGFILDHAVTISVLPMDAGGRTIDVVTRRFPVANEFRSGIFDIDKNTVLLPLGALQRMLKMDAAKRVEIDPATDPFAGFETGEQRGSGAAGVVGVEPARVTTVLVKGAPGVKVEDLRRRCIAIYDGFARAHAGDVPDPAQMNNPNTISTWERQQGALVAAAKKETALLLGILVFISVVVSFLILSIFWSMVSEKTKDIGILRSLGASRAGIAWLWLRYGLAIGVVGSVLGLAAAYAIVWNINPIHEAIIAAGRAFGQDWAIWDPKVYYLFEIPNHVDGDKALIVFIGGLVFSVMGALVPAIRAARMDPVEALRFE